MAITLEQQHTLSTDGDFINRVRQAAATVALEVMSENPATLDAVSYTHLTLPTILLV